MTGREFCQGSAAAVLPGLFRPSNWIVRFRFEVKGSGPQIARCSVRRAHSAAGAVQTAIASRLGADCRPLHSLEVLEVLQVLEGKNR